MQNVDNFTIGTASRGKTAVLLDFVQIRGWGGGEGQNCTGQKCTKHKLVLLMFVVLKCLDDLL